jgi:ribosomal protein L37AE/L43A
VETKAPLCFFRKGRGALWVCIWSQGGGGPKKFGNHWFMDYIDFVRRGWWKTYRWRKRAATCGNCSDACITKLRHAVGMWQCRTRGLCEDGEARTIYTVGLQTSLGAVGWGIALHVGRSRVWFPIVSSSHAMFLGSTQPLTEMSTGNISWG